MDILKQIFSAETPAQTTTTEKKEDKMVLETTVTQEKVRPDVVKEGVTYTKEVQCQPQKEIERIREIEIGTQHIPLTFHTFITKFLIALQPPHENSPIIVLFIFFYLKKRTEKVQPVVHVDREQTEVRQVVQPILEKEVRPTLITKTAKEVELGTRQEKATGLPTPLEGGRSLGAAPAIQSKTEFLGVEKKREEFAPIVEETIHKKIIEQVTPVVEREVVIPHVIEQTKHIHETIQEKEVVTHEIRAPITVEQWEKQEGSVCKISSQKS
jgi:hypothetical protein